MTGVPVPPPLTLYQTCPSGTASMCSPVGSAEAAATVSAFFSPPQASATSRANKTAVERIAMESPKRVVRLP